MPDSASHLVMMFLHSYAPLRPQRPRCGCRNMARAQVGAHGPGRIRVLTSFRGALFCTLVCRRHGGVGLGPLISTQASRTRVYSFSAMVGVAAGAVQQTIPRSLKMT